MGIGEVAVRGDRPFGRAKRGVEVVVEQARRRLTNGVPRVVLRPCGQTRVDILGLVNSAQLLMALCRREQDCRIGFGIRGLNDFFVSAGLERAPDSRGFLRVQRESARRGQDECQSRHVDEVLEVTHPSIVRDGENGYCWA